MSKLRFVGPALLRSIAISHPGGTMVLVTSNLESPADISQSMETI